MSIVFAFLLFILGHNAGISVLPADAVYLSAASARADRLIVGREAAAPPQKIDVLSLGPRLSAQSALAVDRVSGAVLFDKDSRAVRPLASLTKLASALVFLESNPDLSVRVAMSPDDDREGGEKFIRPGESAALGDYLKAALLGSANNATIVLSRSIGVSSAEFVDLMNKKAGALGMRHTKFADPTGLSADNVASAHDVILLLEAASRNDLIKKITSSPQNFITVYPATEIRKVKNTNRLVGSFIKIILSKTGYLDEALYNLAAVVKLKNGEEVDIVVLGSESNEARFQHLKNLAVWAQETYTWKKNDKDQGSNVK